MIGVRGKRCRAPVANFGEGSATVARLIQIETASDDVICVGWVNPDGVIVIALLVQMRRGGKQRPICPGVSGFPHFTFCVVNGSIDHTGPGFRKCDFGARRVAAPGKCRNELGGGSPVLSGVARVGDKTIVTTGHHVLGVSGIEGDIGSFEGRDPQPVLSPVSAAKNCAVAEIVAVSGCRQQDVGLGGVNR